MTHYPKLFEQLLMKKIDENPYVKGMFIVQDRFDMEPRTQWMSYEGEQWKFVDKEESNTCTVALGPHPTGAIVFVTIHPSLLSYGESGAGVLYSAFLFLSKQWQFSMPELIPAQDVTQFS